MPELAPVRKTTCPAVWGAARAGVESQAGVGLWAELELCFVVLSIAVGVSAVRMVSFRGMGCYGLSELDSSEHYSLYYGLLDVVLLVWFAWWIGSCRIHLCKLWARAFFFF